MTRRRDALVLRALLATRRSKGYWRIANALERAGERYGLDSLLYNPLVFAYWHEKGVGSAPFLADAIERAFPVARRYADVGAGTGAFAAELQRRGNSVVAYEHTRWGRFFARSQGLDVHGLDLERVSVGDLASVDVVLCLEVAEHLPPALGDTLVRACAAAAPAVVFTAAVPGQGGTGHVNEQPKRYWIDRFERSAMQLDRALTELLATGLAGAPASWLEANVMVFVATDGRRLAR